MGRTFSELIPYLERNTALEAAIALFDWDMETLSPPQAIENTARIMSLLANEHFANLNDEKLKNLVQELSLTAGLSQKEQAILRELKEGIEKISCIPQDEYKEYYRLRARATAVWAKARTEDDFASFAPVLEEIIEYEKKFAGCRAKAGEDIYDILLQDYEKGFNKKELDGFFEVLKAEIVPLLKKIQAAPEIDNHFLSESYDVDKQKEFARFLAEYIGFDFNKGVLAVSAHPFTTNLHNQDVRITANYQEKHVEGSIFAVIHEAGHGLYEMGIADDLTQTLVGGGASMGMHESQSRFYENMIGRQDAFWEPIYVRLQELFPTQLGAVVFSEFIRGINKIQPGLIRIEADELTYCLHIMVRYEIEKLIMSGKVTISQLPDLWKDKYEEYLGIRPENDTTGILQDIHWSQGSFGYFPSYALGNAIAAQIYHTMEKEIDISSSLKKGELTKIKDYLGEKIHQHGKLKPAKELIKDATGEDFNPQYYIDYLKNKYEKLYGLQ